MEPLFKELLFKALLMAACVAWTGIGIYYTIKICIALVKKDIHKLTKLKEK